MNQLNLQILMEIIMDRGVNVLLEDLKNDPDQDINHLGVCLTKCAETLENDVAQLPAQIIIFLKNHNSPLLQSLVQQAHDYSDSTWLRPRHQLIFNEEMDVWTNRQAHTNFIGSIVALPDNERFVTASEDGTIKVWHIDGSLLETLTDHDDAVNSIKLSPDKTRLLAASDDLTGSSRPISTWVPDMTFEGHNGYVSEIAQTTTNRVVTAANDGTARIYSAKTGRCLHVLRTFSEWVYGLAVSPDGTRAITSSLNNSMFLWDVRSGQQIKTVGAEDVGQVHMLSNETYIGARRNTEAGHEDAPYELRWSEDGTRVVSVWKDIIVWDACDDAFVEVMRLIGHGRRIQDLALFDNDTKLITVAHSIKIWDLQTGEELAAISGHDDLEIYSVAITPDEQYFMTGDKNGLLKCWNLNAILTNTNITGHMSAIGERMHISTNTQTALTIARDGDGRLWDTQTGQPLHRLTGHFDYSVNAWGFINNDTQCVTTHAGVLRVWDVATGHEVHCFKHDNPQFGFHGLSFYNNDSAFVCGAAGYPMFKGCLVSGEFTKMSGNTEYVHDFAWRESAKQVLTNAYFSPVHFEQTPDPQFPMPEGFEYTAPVQLWDVQKECLIAQFYPEVPRGDRIYKEYPCLVTWRNNETQVVGFYSNGYIHVWDRDSGTLCHSFQAVDGHICGYKMLDDETIMVLSLDQPQVRIWDLPSQSMTFELNVSESRFVYSALNHDATLLAGRMNAHTICVIELKTGHILSSFTHQHEITQLTFKHDILIIGDARGYVVCLELVHVSS